MSTNWKPYYWRTRKAWYIYYVNDEGKRAKKKIGDTRKEAYGEYDRMVLAANVVAKSAVTGDPLFEDISTRWLEDQERRHQQGDVGVKWLLRVSATIDRWNISHEGWTVSQMTPAAVKTWLDKPSANYERTELGALAQCLRWAHKWKLIESNPLAGLELPGMQSRRGIVSSGNQANILAAAKHAKPLIQVAWLSGCRPGELRELKWEQLSNDLTEAVLVIHKTSRRTGRVRRIFFSEQASEIVDAQKRLSEYVFLNSRKKPWTSNGLVQAMRKISEATGIKVTAGQYRHTFTTNALEKGLPIATVAELLGHTSTNMVSRVYSHLYDKKEYLKQAISLATSPLPAESDQSQPDAGGPSEPA